MKVRRSPVLKIPSSCLQVYEMSNVYEIFDYTDTAKSKIIDRILSKIPYIHNYLIA